MLFKLYFLLLIYIQVMIQICTYCDGTDILLLILLLCKKNYIIFKLILYIIKLWQKLDGTLRALRECLLTVAAHQSKGPQTQLFILISV